MCPHYVSLTSARSFDRRPVLSIPSIQTRLLARAHDNIAAAEQRIAARIADADAHTQSALADALTKVHAVTDTLSAAHDAKLKSAFAAFRTETAHSQAAALSDLSAQQAAAIHAVSARQSAFETTIVARADALEARVMTAIDAAQKSEHKEAEATKMAVAEAMSAKAAIEAAAAKAVAEAAASASAIAMQQQLQQQWNADSLQRASAQDTRVEALVAEFAHAQNAMTAMRATVDDTAAKQIAMGAEWAAIKTAHMQQLEMQQQQKSSVKASVLNEVENELVSAKLMVDVQNTMMQVCMGCD